MHCGEPARGCRSSMAMASRCDVVFFILAENCCWAILLWLHP